MKVLSALGYFVYDFVIGDDWKIAAYVLAVLALAAGLLAAGAGDTAVVLLCTGALVVCFALGVRLDARSRR